MFGGGNNGGGRYLPPKPDAARTSLLNNYLSSHPFQQPGTVPGSQPFQPSPPGGGGGYDIASDPIWQKIQTIDQATVSQAKAQALAAERQLAIRLGDATGITGDKNTADQATNNPYSTLALLRSQYGNTVTAHDEQLNKDNLFYSGARAKTLSDDANAYQQNVYTARQQAMDQLSAIQQALLGAENNAQAADTQGLQDAYTRGINQAATYGYDPGAAAAPTVAGSLAAPPGQPALRTPGFKFTNTPLRRRPLIGQGQ